MIFMLEFHSIQTAGLLIKPSGIVLCLVVVTFSAIASSFTDQVAKNTDYVVSRMFTDIKNYGGEDLVGEVHNALSRANDAKIKRST